MRVVSGRLKGRRFELPSGKWKTRPTTDYAKESLFNILSNRIELEGLRVLDLFAGTGSIAYEFASRGAEKVVCVDKFGGCVRFIRKQAAQFGIEAILEVYQQDVFKFLQQHQQQYDLIFVDPPYAIPNYKAIPDLIAQKDLLTEDGDLIIEHDQRQNFETAPNFVEMRQYGQSYFSFLSK